MNQQKHIFTIMAGCAPIGVKMLESYCKFHNEKIHVYLFGDDYGIIDDYKWRSDFTLLQFDYHILDDSLKSDFKQGHLGTAKAWAQVVKENHESYLIHIDSDVIFKKESLSLIEKAGYPEIYGSRRCYKNNPGKSPVQEGLEDTVSTYFVGINADCIAHDFYDENLFVGMFQGTFNPLHFPVLDFFDPVFFHMRENKARVYYEDSNIIGGQDESGSKVNNYPSNLHLDMGSHLAHFGGVGSGYQASKDDSGMNKDYSNWAKYRWYLFDCLFYNSFFISPELTGIMDGRWVSGPGTNEIFEQIKKDLDN